MAPPGAGGGVPGERAVTPRAADVAVIGAGPGGYVAAIRLGQLGKKAIVVDRDLVGGTCLNYGCIPSKAVISAAKLYHKLVRDGARMGILFDNPRIDMKKMQEWKGEIVGKLTRGIAQLLKHYGQEVMKGTATFKDPHTLTVSGNGSSMEIAADHFVIATGAAPIPLPFLPFDGVSVLSSREMLDLARVPERLAVIGGGIIGLELGMAFAKLGSRLTVVELTSQLLPGIDPDLVRVVERKLKKDGATILCPAKVVGASRKGSDIALSVEDGAETHQVTADVVLVAIGVKPAAQALDLDKAGVGLTDRGFVAVDTRLRTSAPHIFAIGDVAGPPFLAHKASKEGEIVAEVIAGKPAAFDCRAMPSAVFTDPEIAVVGLAEGEARSRGHRVAVGKFPLAANGRALTTGEAEGLVKVVADAGTKEILGVHIVGPDASDLIAEAALAIEMTAGVEDVGLTVHPHPTLSEALMEAAKAAVGEAVHILNEPAVAARG